MSKVTEGIEGVIDGIAKARSLDGICAKAAKRVARATSSAPVKGALSGTWLGHALHPALTDLPIGAWAMASLLDVTAGRSGANAARRLVGAGVLAAVPTAASGASDWSDCYGPTRRVGFVHGAANAAATVLQGASWIARHRGRRETGMALSGVGMGLVVFTSYLGAHLSLVKGVAVNHTAFEDSVTEWTDVAAESDLTDDQVLRVTADGVPVVLVRRAGNLYALSATCTHAGGPLDEGTLLDDDCIRCPWHGSVFRLADGAVVRGPAAVAEPSWHVKAADGRILIRSASN